MATKLDLKDIIKREFTNCAKACEYFLSKYSHIQHPIRGKVLFDLYRYQRKTLDQFAEHDYNIVLKGRQIGISTLVAGYALWLMLFHNDKNILVIATKQETAKNLVTKVRYMHANLPVWLRGNCVEDNKLSMRFSNGSQIKAVARSKDAGRSEAVSLLVVDEAAHIDNMETIWTGLYPTISTGGRCIALSSPNGIGNWFHKTYEDAENGQNLFIPTNLPWNVHPEHDQEWFDNETKNLGKREIAQEYLCNFNASGETVIDPEDLEILRKHTEEPKHKSWIDRNFHIWKPYNHQGKYLLVADVARGDGEDYSVFHIINVSTMEQVAEYQGKCEPEDFCKLLMDVGKEYGNALMVIENNNIGFSVAQRVAQLGYRNLYYSNKTTHEYVEQNAAYGNSNVVPGFTTSVKTRPLIIAKLDEIIRNKAITINSARLVRELEKFIWVNGRPEAQKGYNDDLVMSLAIACWVRDTSIINNQKDVELSKALLNSLGKSKSSLNTSIKGMYNHKQIENDTAKNMYKELSWLFKG